MLIVCPSCTSRYEIDPAKLGPDGRKVRCPSCAFEWHAHGEGHSRTIEPPAVDASQPPMRPDQTAEAFVEEEWARAAAIDRAVSEAVSQGAGEDTAIAIATSIAADAPTPEAVTADFEPEPVAAPTASVAARSKWGAGKAKAGRGWFNFGFLKWRLPHPFRLRFSLPTGFLGAMLSPGSIVIAGLIVLSAIVIQRREVVRTMPQMATLFETIGLPVNLRGIVFEGIQTELVEDAQGRYLIVQGEIRNVVGNPVTVPAIEITVQDGSVKSLYTWTMEPPKATLGRGDTASFRTRLASPPLGGVNVAVRFASGGKSALN